MKTQICVAKLLSPHGVQGLMKLHSFTSPATNLFNYDQLVDDQGCQLKLQLKNPMKGNFIVKIDGVDDANAADLLKGAFLYIHQDQLDEALDEDEFYQHQLIGLKVFDADNHMIGVVRALHNFGADDMLEIAFEGDETTNRNDYSYHPFTKHFVPVVNIKEGYLTINPYLDEEGKG